MTLPFGPSVLVLGDLALESTDFDLDCTIRHVDLRLVVTADVVFVEVGIVERITSRATEVMMRCGFSGLGASRHQLHHVTILPPTLS